MILTEYLGNQVSRILESDPFKHWPVATYTEDNLDEEILHYIFSDHGLELRCDAYCSVCAIFIFSQEYGGFDESLFEIPFSLKREQVLEHFGEPSKTGERFSDPILGEYGAWDRFRRPGIAIHVEYRADADEISKITLMRSDIIP